MPGPKKIKASFIEPMLLLRTNSLPSGKNWLYELKLDGYRALAIKSGGRVELRSRNNNDFGGKYPRVVKALASLPDDTVVDGEIIALDPSGKPSFNLLQNYGSANAAIVYYLFDVLVLAGEDVRFQSLGVRRALLEARVLTVLDEPIRSSPELDASLPDLIASAAPKAWRD